MRQDGKNSVCHCIRIVLCLRVMNANMQFGFAYMQAAALQGAPGENLRNSSMLALEAPRRFVAKQV